MGQLVPMLGQLLVWHSFKMTKQSKQSGTIAHLSLEGKRGELFHILRQMKIGQQLSAGFVWLTRTNPGAVQFASGGGVHGLGLHVTALVDSSQMQFWHLYSNFSLNCQYKPQQGN